MPPRTTPAQPYFPVALRVEGHSGIRYVGEAGDSLFEDTPRLPALRPAVWPSTQAPPEILGAPYFLEFYLDDKDDPKDLFAAFFHRDVIRTVHAHGDAPSYRSLLIDCSSLYKKIDGEKDALNISLSASPDIRVNGNVGYRTLSRVHAVERRSSGVRWRVHFRGERPRNTRRVFRRKRATERCRQITSIRPLRLHGHG